MRSRSNYPFFIGLPQLTLRQASSLFAAAILAACACNPEPVKPEPEPAEITYEDFVSAEPVSQTNVPRITSMPQLPQTYKMIDWHDRALRYDAYVFDWDRNDDVGPLIWADNTKRNGMTDGFGLYTTVGDVRQGPKNEAGHESINTLAAVMGGGLMGIDKTNQDGRNYARMVQKYYGLDNDWKIFLNNTSGYATDWWYNVLPNLLWFGVYDVFPEVEGARDILYNVAVQHAKSDEIMGDSYDHAYFNFFRMQAYDKGIFQQDVAGGYAYMLINAWREFGDEYFLERAINAADVFNSQTESRLYEIIMPFGIYAAAYLNAAFGKQYDLQKMLGWNFDGCKSWSGRYGWGVICAKWGDYDVYGLQGSITDGGGYAFLMNSFEMAWPLVPMVKYAPQYASMIGRWMLNNASASRLFFPDQIDDAHQYAPELKDLTGGVIGYEGLRKTDRYGTYDVVPIAEGDGPSWTSDNPVSSMFSLYSTSPIGIFGSMISTTDVEGVIRLDCNVTDLFAERKYPVNMYYNPYDDERSVTYSASHLTPGRISYATGPYDLFDIVEKAYVAKNVSADVVISLPGNASRVIVELPAGTQLLLGSDGHIYDSEKTVVAY